VDQIRIPVMVVHGARDVRVAKDEAEQIVQALSEKDIPYEYMLFDDEGHGIMRPENRMLFYAAAEAFLARHLGGRAEK
jgi:dipeptidyl aminopeptidase/acylaminoacyl peptidase